MKRIMAVLLITAVCVVTAPAQYSRVKEKARNLDDKMTERHNAAESGAPPPGLPPKNGATPGQPAAQPVAAPIKPSTQQQAATKLKADIAAVRAKGVAATELKKQFVQDLQMAVMGQNRPTVATLTQFTDSFLAAIAAKDVSAANDAKIVQNLVVSLNSAGLSAPRLQEITGEVESALTKAGAPAGDAAKAAQGLNAIIAEVQSGAGK